VPFTLSHAAAALPFRRFPLIPSALVIGTLAPDFEYFLLLIPMDRYGHTLRGLFILTLPVALVILWMFHNFVKRPASMLLPDSIQRRLADHLDEFQFRGFGRFLMIVISILVGAFTHLLWDSFTHRTGWFYHHWLFLHEMVRVPVLGTLPYYKVFQHVSTVLGIVILLLWFAWWYRNTKPTDHPIPGAPAAPLRLAIVAVLATIACAGAVINGAIAARGPAGHFNFREFVVEAVVTITALAWWELVAYGIFFQWTRPLPATPVPLEANTQEPEPVGKSSSF
jgi:ABC-type multidrug transport system fused ATPase/permease subunit